MFCKGDRVEVKSGMYNNLIGKRGTIMHVNRFDVGICFDEYMGGHDLAGLCEDGYGWWISQCEIRSVGEYFKSDISIDEII